ncbi:MAG: peptidase M3, partial [Bacteroidota bacterium]
MKKLLFIVLVTGLALSSCQNQKKETAENMENPFFKEWTTPFEVPPFDEIKVEHYVPAVKEGIKQQQAEIDAIVANSEEPTFENTILALDKSGVLLKKAGGVFGPLNSADTNEEMQAVARELSPLRTAHYNNIAMNAGLFKRIKAVYDKRDELNFDQEQMRVVEKLYEDFERGGANLSAEDQEKLKAINIELSGLYLQFGENLLAETNKNFKLVIDNEEDLAGLPDDVIARAATAAEKAGETGKWVFTLAKPSWIPFLTFSEKRELREKLY